MKKSFIRLLFAVVLAVLATGCSSLLPTEDSRTRVGWTNFSGAQAAFDKIIPQQTKVADLKSLGFDPLPDTFWQRSMRRNRN